MDAREAVAAVGQLSAISYQLSARKVAVSDRPAEQRLLAASNGGQLPALRGLLGAATALFHSHREYATYRVGRGDTANPASSKSRSKVKASRMPRASMTAKLTASVIESGRLSNRSSHASALTVVS